ncbi:MAG: S8 family serine peptidase [Clostridiales bacterium]|nr:S8 family serine peptidase [Clostridiales bacterium]
MKTNNANKTQRLKSRRAKLLITVLVACLLISMFPLSSFSSSGMPWWFYPPPEGYVPRINPVSFEVFLTQEYSLLDIGDIRLMFDGMGIRSITDRNGKLIKDPDLPKDFQRLLILFTEEQGVSSVIDAVARVGMLSFVSEARLLWSSTYLFGSQNPPEGAFSPEKVLVVLERSCNLLDMETLGTLFEGMGFCEIRDLTARSLERRKTIEGYDFSKFNRILGITLENPSEANVITAINNLMKKDFVRNAEPSFRRYVLDVAIGTNDPEPQWNLVNINAGAAWAKYGANAANVRVAIADTGISPHGDLDVNLAEGLYFPDLDDTYYGTVDYFFGHGSHVAGIVGAVGNNGIGISGVAHQVELVPYKVAFDSDNGPVFYDYAIVDAVDYADGDGIDVINMSFGDYVPNSAIYAAIENYPGLVVCAAGNGTFGVGIDNDLYPMFPASYGLSNIISVAAIDSGNDLVVDQECWWASNYGAVSVHIAAPGMDIVSTVSTYDDGDDAYVSKCGTSMAAPHVTGVAALLKGCFPSATTAQIKEAILNSAAVTPGLMGKVSTNGRLDALAALDYMDALMNPLLYGDVDSNGRVAAMDATLLSRYLAGWPGIVINEAAADVDCDGLITPTDLTILQRHIAGWPGYETLPYQPAP